MIETIIGSILDAVFASIADSVGLSDRLRELLGRDPEKLAFRTALTLALKDATEQFPGRDLQYFAEALRDFGSALLARTLQPSTPFPTANELTEHWLAHLNLDSVRYYRADFERFATVFLTRLRSHLENQQSLQWIVQLRTQKIATDAAIRMANAAEQNLARFDQLNAQFKALTEQIERLSQTYTEGGAVIGGNVQVGGHFAGRDFTIHNYLTSGLANLHVNYSARIEEFLLEYLGSKRKRVPFGGRSAQLNELDTWLNDRNAPPYYLMTAEAGRGKSALVCRWQTQVLMRGDVEVIFIPISIRFETATQDVVFAALAARLAVIHGEQIQAAALSADQWRATCQSYLRRDLPTGKTLLLIVDGLDEATGWTPGRGLVPGDPLAGLRVLVTARQRAGELGPQGWAATLGWDDDGLATKTSLVGLDRFGVQEALVSMGNPLDRLATQVDVVGELYRLTEGDPLLVRLYVDALVGRGKATAYLRAEELAAIQPGLQGYFDRWWDEQHQQWRSERRDPLVEQEQLLTLLNAVAAALGPLALSDLTSVSELANGVFVRRLAQTVSRWLVGDGRNQGYTFSHPRLGYYFWEQMGEVEQSKWDERFTGWGAKTIEALNRGDLTPKAAPHYLVQHYSSHLRRSRAPAAQFYTLLTDGWRQAWEVIDVTNSGFLNDVAAVESQAQTATNRSQTDIADALIQQIKAALCRASIRALGSHITPELLRLALIHGLRTPAQALTIAKLMPNDEQRASTLVALLPLLTGETLWGALAAARAIGDESARAETLIALAPYLPQALLGEALAAARKMSVINYFRTLRTLAPYLPQELLGEELAAARALSSDTGISSWFGIIGVATLNALAPHLPYALLGEALMVARAIGSESVRSDTLRALASHLPQEQQAVVLGEALAAARAIGDESTCVKALCALIPHLPQDQQAVVLGEALAATRAIERGYFRAQTLCALVPHLSQEQLGVVLGEELVAIRTSGDDSDRANILLVLIPHLPQALLGEALASARAIKSESSRADALIALAPHLTQEEQRVALREALAAARTKPYESVGVRTLIALAPHLPQTLLGEVLAAARTIPYETVRADTLIALAPHLLHEEQGAALGEALAAARAIEDETSRSQALCALIPHLPQEQQTILLNEALAVARTIGDESSRADILIALAPHLPQTLFSEALAAARPIGDESTRVRFLSALVPHLPQELLSDALAVARAIGNKSSRADILIALAPHLPQKLLIDALAAARPIGNEFSRARTLIALALRLPQEQQGVVLAEALAIARAIVDSSSRAHTLIALALHLPQEQQGVVLQEALAVTRAIVDEFYRICALCELAPHLPQEQQGVVLHEALAVAKTIEEERSRAGALCALLPHLPQEMLGEALVTARAIKNEVLRGETLISLAPHLPQEMLGEALAVAKTIRLELSAGETLISLAPHLPQEMLGEALSAARAIRHEYPRARTLNVLAQHLPQEQQEVVLGEALAIARAISEERYRAEALCALVPHLPQGKQGVVLQEALAVARMLEKDDSRARILSELAPHLIQWDKAVSNNVQTTLLDTCRHLSYHPRPEFFSDLASLLPVLLALTGDESTEVAAGIFQALHDVSTWWP